MQFVSRGDSVKSIVRIKKETNFVVMDKSFLNDTTLSWKAKGIMAYMLSKPDDWTFYISELIKHATDGKASFRSGFTELRDSGYVRRIKKRNEDGTFSWETIVHERPRTDFPHVDNPHVEIPHADNRPLLHNDSTKNDSTKHDSKYIVEIVTYLNRVADKNYRHTTRKTQDFIRARMNEGFTVDDFKKVIDIKNDEWKDNPKMQKFIRPETLFGTKFESYLNQKTTISTDDGYDYGF